MQMKNKKKKNFRFVSVLLKSIDTHFWQLFEYFVSNLIIALLLLVRQSSVRHCLLPIRLGKIGKHVTPKCRRKVVISIVCLPLARNLSSCKMQTAFKQSIDASISVQSVNIFLFLFLDDTKLRWHFVGYLLINSY